jgi:hypothetical protein
MTTREAFLIKADMIKQNLKAMIETSVFSLKYVLKHQSFVPNSNASPVFIQQNSVGI